MIRILHRLTHIPRTILSLTQTSKFPFSLVGVQPKRYVDKSKASIKFMTEAPETQLQIEYLKRSHQYNAAQALRIFNVMEERFMLGQAATLIVDSELIQFDLLSGLERFRRLLIRTLQVKNPNISTLKLHESQNLPNLLFIATHLQKFSDPKLPHILLAILTNYIENYEEITKLDLYRIMAHLTARCYLSRNMMKYFGEGGLAQVQGLERVVKGQGQGAIGVAEGFQMASCMLQCLFNLERIEKYYLLKQKDRQPNMSNPKLKQQLIPIFFQFLENPTTLHQVLEHKPSTIFLDGLLVNPEHRSRYFSIIQKILNPLFYPTAKMEDTLMMAIFDKLLIFAQGKDRPAVIRILDLYAQYVSNYQCNSYDQRRSGSLLMLCDKFNHFSKPLFYDITVNYLRMPPTLKSLITSPLRKNKLNVHLMQAMRVYELGIVIQLAADQKFSLEGALVEDFQYKVGRMLENQYLDVRELLVKGNYDRESPPPQNTEQAYNIYLMYDEFVYPEGKLARFTPIIENIEKELQIKYSKEELENYSRPINIKTSNGARLKMLVWIAIFARRILKSPSYFQEFYKIIDNEEIIKSVQAWLLYPGLVEGIFTLYYLALQQNISMKNSPLQALVKSTRPEIDKIVQKNLNTIKKSQQKSSVIPEFCNHVEFMSNPYGAGPSTYGKSIAQLYKNMFQETEIVRHLKRNQGLIAKITDFLSQLKGKNNADKFYAFSNHVEFPFVADYVIFFNNKKFVILIVDPIEKQRYQSILKKIRIKNSPAESKPINMNKQAREQINYMTTRELSLNYYSSTGTVILISCEQDLKNLRIITDRNK